VFAQADFCDVSFDEAINAADFNPGDFTLDNGSGPIPADTVTQVALHELEFTAAAWASPPMIPWTLANPPAYLLPPYSGTTD
jgi:hypothetical protein